MSAILKNIAFDDVFEDVTKHYTKLDTQQYCQSGRTPIIDQSESFIAGYTDLVFANKATHDSAIVFGDHTRRFKYIDFDFCIGADGAKVLRPKIEASTKYLYHYLNSLKIESNGYSRHFKFLKRTFFNIPPLAEQKRIAAILDKAAEIKAKREQAIAKLDELAQSTFLSMFGEQISSSPKTVGDFFEVNVNKYETNLKDTDGVSFVPMSAVSEISKTIESEESRAYSDVKKGYTPIKRGDLIVAKITPCYENGKQAIATTTTQFAYGSTEFHTFRSSNKDLITLLHYYLQTKNVMREGAANMKGAAGQKRVPDTFFKSLPFSSPALSEINKFCSLIACQKKLRAEQVRQLAVIENTIRSLQNQAFTTGFN